MVPRTERNTAPLPLILIIAAASFICGFIVLFVLTNDHWTPVYIPGFPWRAEPVFAAWEMRFSFVIACAFGAGMAAMALPWLLWYRGHRRQMAQNARDIAQIENELQKTNRLIATSAALRDSGATGEHDPHA